MLGRVCLDDASGENQVLAPGEQHSPVLVEPHQQLGHRQHSVMAQPARHGAGMRRFPNARDITAPVLPRMPSQSRPAFP